MQKREANRGKERDEAEEAEEEEAEEEKEREKTEGGRDKREGRGKRRGKARVVEVPVPIQVEGQHEIFKVIIPLWPGVRVLGEIELWRLEAPHVHVLEVEVDVGGPRLGEPPHLVRVGEGLQPDVDVLLW